MTVVATWVGQGELDSITREVREHPHALRIGRLCFDVLSRQAEGKALFVARDWLEARAREHGLTRIEGDCAFGNVLLMLERGPESARERMLISAFASRGYAATYEGEEDHRVIDRFARHAEWLERSSGYSPLTFLDSICPPSLAGQTWLALASMLESDVEAPTPAARSRRASLVAILARASHHEAAEALVRLAESASDPAVRALSQALGPQAFARGRTVITGRRVRVTRGWFVELVRGVSGLALLSRVVSVMGSAIALRRDVALEVGARDLRVVQTTSWFGRQLFEREAVTSFDAVDDLRRDVRHGYIRTTLGVAALLLAVGVGGGLAIEGIRNRVGVWVALGFGVLASGAWLDWLLEVIVPSLARRVRLTLVPKDGRAIGLEVEDSAAAAKWLEAYRERRTR